MPFLITLDQPIELPSTELYAAQQSYAQAHSVSSGTVRSRDSNGAGTPGSEIERNPDGAVLDSDRPKLKRRPKPPQQ